MDSGVDISFCLQAFPTVIPLVFWHHHRHPRSLFFGISLIYSGTNIVEISCLLCNDYNFLCQLNRAILKIVCSGTILLHTQTSYSSFLFHQYNALQQVKTWLLDLVFCCFEFLLWLLGWLIWWYWEGILFFLPISLTLNFLNCNVIIIFIILYLYFVVFSCGVNAVHSQMENMWNLV